MKKVLLTGSNGLLGQKIIEQAANWPTISLIATSKGPNRCTTKAGYCYEELDLLKPEQVADVLNKYQPDVLIHAAAMTQVDQCHQNPEACQLLNVEATYQLAQHCDRLGIHMVYLSTDFVFDGLAGPYSEDDVPQPVSIYGQSKLQAENIVRQMQAKWSIVRTILVYGVLADMSRSNIVLWAKNALENQQAIRVVNNQWRMPTLAEDLAWACLQIANKGADGIFHISGNEMMSIAEMVAKIADFWQLDKGLISEITSESLAQEAKRPVKTGFVLDKAKRVLQYKPHSLADGLKLFDQQMAVLQSK